MPLQIKERAERRLTKQEEILDLLERAGKDGVSTGQLVRIQPRFSARIYELRKNGWVIDRLEIPGSDNCRYILRGQKITMGQLVLF